MFYNNELNNEVACRADDDWIPIQNNVFSAISNYVIAHQEDIEAEINDFGDLKIVLDWFNRGSINGKKRNV